MMSGFIVGTCWIGGCIALLVQCRRIELRRRRRAFAEHKQRVAEYEFLRTTERVHYPLVSVSDRMGPRRRPSYYTCQAIWEATEAQEQRDREEWKRAAQ